MNTLYILYEAGELSGVILFNQQISNLTNMSCAYS